MLVDHDGRVEAPKENGITLTCISLRGETDAVPAYAWCSLTSNSTEEIPLTLLFVLAVSVRHRERRVVDRLVQHSLSDRCDGLLPMHCFLRCKQHVVSSLYKKGSFEDRGIKVAM